MKVKLNDEYYYQLPHYYDPEGNEIFINLSGSSLSFVELTENRRELKITPVPFSLIGVHSLTVELKDQLVGSIYTFKITVTNTPPRFSLIEPSFIRVRLNTETAYELPAFHDAEGHDIYINAVYPPYVRQDYSTFYFHPTSTALLGLPQIKIEGELRDQVSSTRF